MTKQSVTTKENNSTSNSSAAASSAKQKTSAAKATPAEGNKEAGASTKKTQPREKREAPRAEFEQKVIDIRRVTRVIAGGRRFSFRVTVIIGDMKGKVGVGVDKGGDTAVAIGKAVARARKNMVKLNLGENMTIPYEVQTKYGSSELLMKPSPGRGIVAGSSVRSVLQMAGVTDVVAKLLSRSGNKLNNARVTIEAFKKLGLQEKNK